MIRPTQFRHYHKPAARYQIRAWGSDRYPDLNHEASVIPDRLHKHYPFVDIQRLDPLPLSSLKEFLNGQA